MKNCYDAQEKKCCWNTNQVKWDLWCIKTILNLYQDAAGRHFSFILLKKSFQTWVARWQRQVELAQFEDLITYKGNVAVARRVLVHWKHCILTSLKWFYIWENLNLIEIL